MTAKDAIRFSIEQSRGWLTMLLADMKAEPLTCPTPRGGNHPLWILGHLAHSEAGMVAEFIQGEPNPLAKWDALFGMGSQPAGDAKAYPSWEELTSAYDHTRGRTLKLLDSLTDADLDKSTRAPEHLQALFGTVGRVLCMLGQHASFHAGQVADARRSVGRKPVLG